jgi:hypothetical protein
MAFLYHLLQISGHMRANSAACTTPKILLTISVVPSTVILNITAHFVGCGSMLFYRSGNGV